MGQGRASRKTGLALPIEKVKGESAAGAHEPEKAVSLIPKEYWDLQEVFSEWDSDIIPPLPQQPMDC